LVRDDSRGSDRDRVRHVLFVNQGHPENGGARRGCPPRSSKVEDTQKTPFCPIAEAKSPTRAQLADFPTARQAMDGAQEAPRSGARMDALAAA
jgi:hypothetical protein